MKGRRLPRADELSGSVPPAKRLPVTITTIASGARASGARRVRQAVSRRQGSGVSLTQPPPWPQTVPRPPVKSQLGADYDTAWARRYPAKVARVFMTEFITRPALAAIATPTIEGLDRIAHLDEPVIFAANHASHLDAPLIVSHLPDRWRYRVAVAGAADYFFDTKLKSVAFALSINAVPFERRRVSRRSTTVLSDLLAEGWSLLIFPEGGRSPDGWGQEHRPIPSWVAVRTGRPVVPVYLAGTNEILPRSASRLKPGRTTLSFGRPIHPEVGGDARALAVEIERAVAALADEQRTDSWTAARRAADRKTPSLLGPDASPWRRHWALGAPVGRDRRPAGSRWVG